MVTMVEVKEEMNYFTYTKVGDRQDTFVTLDELSEEDLAVVELEKLCGRV